MKKILILTVTAGNGHNACANGMRDKLKQMDPSVDIKVVDLLKSFSNPMSIWFADSGYNFAVSRALPIYHYFFINFKNIPPEYRYSRKCVAQGASLSTVDGLLKEIYDYKPDVIYCTHFYPAIAISDLRLKYNIPCKVIVSNLDYVNSPFWEAANGVDYFAIPNEDFIDECIYKGYKLNQLLPIGLPVDERTLEIVDKKEARRKLGLDENTPTIMVMFGGGFWSGGFKIFEDLISSLKGRKVQVIMINGKNEKGYKAIEKMKFEDGIKVLNVGFTKDIPLYLSAADFILNKFGGTSVTEMINKSLPVIVTEKIPTQERYNLNYMKDKGVALSFKNKKELKKHVDMLLDDPQMVEEMSMNARKMRKNTIKELAEFILSFPNADYSTINEDEINYKKVKRAVKTSVRKESTVEIKKARVLKRDTKKAKQTKKYRQVGGLR